MTAAMILLGLLIVVIVLLFAVCVYLLLAFLKRNKKLEFSPEVFTIREEVLLRSPDQELRRTGLKAFVRCNSARRLIKREYSYKGFGDCALLKSEYDNDSGCEWGCLGFGSCADICPQDAITIENGTAVVGSSCIGCGRCLDVCPNGLFSLIPADADYSIPCAAHGGSKMREICSSGCIGCGECEKVGGPEGFYVKDNLASIDYRRGGDRSYAAGRCSMSCIVKFKQNEKNSFKLWRFWSTLITGGKDSE